MFWRGLTKLWELVFNPFVFVYTIKYVQFNSAESQVSYSDHCCLSSLNLSHFHFLLQIHWADFNQTCHKAFFDEGDSSLSNLRPRLFLRVDKNKIVKNIGKFKDLLSHRNNFKQIWHKASLNERNQCVFRWKAMPFSKGRW